MITNINLFFITNIILLMLSGCVSLEKLQKAPIKGNAFEAALAKNYTYLAKKKIKAHDFIDAQYFINKGLVAAGGNSPLPTNIDYWRIPKNKIPELSIARKKLLQYLYDRKAKDTKAELAAKAQIYFDCWVDEEDAKFKNPKIAITCKVLFYKSIYALSHSIPTPHTRAYEATIAKITKASQAQAVKNIVEKNPHILLKDNIDKKKYDYVATKSAVVKSKPILITKNSTNEKVYNLKLADNNAKLDDQMRMTLASIATFIKEDANLRVNIFSVVSSGKNQEEQTVIAKYRAQIVKDTLKNHGVKSEKITSKVFTSLASLQKEISQDKNIVNVVISNK
jgi:outer membrane protein OmpA-like peptidoglycan-associated protein